MRYFFVLVLAVALALALTACGGDEENGGAEPGNLEEETGDPGVVDEDEPEIIEGEWFFVDGEFHEFTDVSFINYFKEYEATYSLSEEYEPTTFQSKYLGDDKVEGTKTRHFSVTVAGEGVELGVELWFTETGELVQAGGWEQGGEFSTETDPGLLAGFEEDFFAHYCSPFVMLRGQGAGENGDEFTARFTDPEAFDRIKSENGYVINEISSQKRDFGTGKVTVIRYDYSIPDQAGYIHEIAKIGDKYMLVYG